MSIRDKLSRFLKKKPVHKRQTKDLVPRVQPSGPALRDRLHALSDLQSQLSALTDDGELITFEQIRQWQPGLGGNPRVFKTVESLSANTRHGARSLAPNPPFNGELLAKVVGEPRLAEFEIDDALFIDIEATGLSHGAGTLAFMIGIGWYEDAENFRVEQIVLKDPNDELEQLKELKKHLERKSFLVSFNGKSYDLSVLQSRMAMHRLYSPRESELKLTPHIDLLHLYRAIWGKSLPNCRLGTLEEAILGWKRENDVPGAIVPSLYFAYLQTGDARTLDPILKHNRWDILSMVSLLFFISHEVSHPEDIQEHQRLIQLGHLLNRRGEFQSSKNIADHLLQRNLAREQQNAALHIGIKAVKSLKQHHLLYPLLHTLTEQFPEDGPGWIERSKYEEHRLKDYVAALHSAKRAVELEPIMANDIERRLNRLTRKVGSTTSQRRSSSHSLTGQVPAQFS